MAKQSNEMKFPKTTIERLIVYYHALENLIRRGTETVSSEELGERLNIKSSQIRKDLSYFGDFGKRGMGYDVRYLLKELRYILGLDRKWNCVVIGAGHLGMAFANYQGFHQRGFNVIGIFDNDKKKIGMQVGDLKVKSFSDISAFVEEYGVDIGIVTVPDNAAQGVVDVLGNAGVRALLNFAPALVTVPGNIKLLDVDLATKLEVLAYYMSFSKDKLWKIFT